MRSRMIAGAGLLLGSCLLTACATGGDLPGGAEVVARAGGQPVYAIAAVSRHSPGDYRDNPQVGAAERQAELARKEAALCPGGAEAVGSQRRRVTYQDIYFRQELDQIDEVIRDTRRIRCL